MKRLKNNIALEEYRWLLKCLEANKQARRLSEIQAEIIEEELDEVEHLLEKTEK